MTPLTRAYLQIHFCVLLWGVTAILGKLISLPALALVWWRMLLVVAALMLVPRVWRGLRRMSGRLILAYAGIGVIVSLHWLTFYAAVKLANASVAATCIALGPVFLAFIEPWIGRRRFDRREFLLGVAVVPGVALVVGGIPDDMRIGIVVGVASAFLAALFSAFNKRLVTHGDPLTVTGIELAAGTVLLSILAPFLPHSGPLLQIPDWHDTWLLLLLAYGCTLLPFALSLVALRELSTFSTLIAINLEPVYAVLLAIPLLGEQHELNPRFYIGVLIIVAAVFAQPLLRRRPQAAPQPDLLGAAESVEEAVPRLADGTESTK